MNNPFFTQPILNSPYEAPSRHWKLDKDGQPTQHINNHRRPASYITPVPRPQKRRGAQEGLVLDEGQGLSTADQQYDPMSVINGLRNDINKWRELADAMQWKVTPQTATLLKHWRHHPFNNIKPFFCQLEAMETLIYLTEVAPKLGKSGRAHLDHLARANEDANPGLARIALKLATGAGKTTVMAMLIAWQTVNAVRRPRSENFTKGFLIVTPGLTIRDRLRVLYPNDPDSYYASRELVPNDMLPDLQRAKIIITNYHAFKERDRSNLSSAERALLRGRGDELRTVETEGQMLHRIMPGLMAMKNIMVINDEAHHCYREKPQPQEKSQQKSDVNLTGDERKEAEKNNEAARLWISGLEIVKRKIGLAQVVDLSATPFFLRGSGYAEGTLFPWTMSNFSLMDAIECGIVKVPRVPVTDNTTIDEPEYRNLWAHIGTDIPKKGRSKTDALDPHSLPTKLKTALDVLYGHYAKTFELWQQAKVTVPPCFIVVCNNTSTSKLVYDYIAGFYRKQENGEAKFNNGRLKLFRNFDDNGTPLARPRTLLIDSQQLESGGALDKNFRNMAADEIDRFRREIIKRTGDRRQADNLSDQDLLREVMNTVGKPGRLGADIRCVVSVSMLTEGWDATTVTHVLGVRAFGTQLLCEQVVGRALRRQSYQLNEKGLLDVEYADILGIPFDFTTTPVVSAPQPPHQTIHVQAIRPARDACQIRFPRVDGYRVELPQEQLRAKFNEDSTLHLTPNLVGPTQTKTQGLIGESVDLNLIHTKELRHATLLYNLTKHLLETDWRDSDGQPKLYLFGQLKRITNEYLNNHVVYQGGTYPAQLMYRELADIICKRITAGIQLPVNKDAKPVQVVFNPYNPCGSTEYVNFNASAKMTRWQTDAQRCHVNWIICDSEWEAEFCRVAEANPHVRAYIKNHNLGLEVPYRYGSQSRRYRPDFIVLVEDGGNTPLNLIVEIKGYRNEHAKEKATAMQTYWIPGVNNHGGYGRWAFTEFTALYEIESHFNALVEKYVRAPEAA